MWKNLPLDTLGLKIVLIDLPGHGSSVLHQGNDSPSIGFMADQVLGVLDHLEVKEFHIVGHSMGGYVALDIKIKRPSCRKVVLLNSNYWVDTPSKKRDRKRVAKLAFESKAYFIRSAIPGLFLNPEKHRKQVDFLINEALKITSESIAFSSIAMTERNDCTSMLPNADLYIVHGSQDRLALLTQFDRSFKENGSLFTIENSGHMCHFESPVELISIFKTIFVLA